MSSMTKDKTSKLEAAHSKRLFILGAVALDERMLFDVVPKPDSKYQQKNSETYTLGGAGGNLVQAVHLLDQAAHTRTHIDFATRVGLAPQFDSRAKFVNEEIRRLMAKADIQHIETSRGECAVAFNIVAEHPEDRLILKRGNEISGDMAEGLEQTLHGLIGRADFVFIDPRKYRSGPIAAKLAKDLSKCVMTDWSEKEWPEDPQKASAYETILRSADIIVCPNDATLKGMAENIRAPEELFTRLREDFGASHVLMSNSSDPVKIWSNGNGYEIPVSAHEGMKYSNGAGDTRNAGILWSLAQGSDMRKAFEFGTKLASHKIKYPLLDWGNHLNTAEFSL